MNRTFTSLTFHLQNLLYLGRSVLVLRSQKETSRCAPQNNIGLSSMLLHSPSNCRVIVVVQKLHVQANILVGRVVIFGRNMDKKFYTRFWKKCFVLYVSFFLNLNFNASNAFHLTQYPSRFVVLFQELLSEKFNMWQIKNAKLTREFCNDLLIQLKQTHLDPVLQQLQRKEGAKLSFEDIIGRYNQIKDDYHKSAIGAKDVIAAVFFEFHPVSQKGNACICFHEYMQQILDYQKAFRCFQLESGAVL